MSIKETIYNGTDSSFTLQFAGYTFPVPTKVEFTLNGTTVDSVANPTYFDLTDFSDNGLIEFKLGDAGFTSADGGVCTITVFDSTNTDGVVYSSPCGPTYIRVRVC